MFRCFDLNFHSLDHQLKAAGNVDLLLQPSATWGPIGRFHVQENRLRAIDHQFSLVRCASKGYSGIYDRGHNVVSEQITVTRATTVPMELPIWRRNAKSPFQTIGDWLFVSCLIFTAVWIFDSFFAKVNNIARICWTSNL